MKKLELRKVKKFAPNYETSMRGSLGFIPSRLLGVFCLNHHDIHFPKNMNYLGVLRADFYYSRINPEVG